MKNKFVIMEGDDDMHLLEALLPEQLGRAEVVAAGGHSAALSAAASVLSYLKKDTLLLLDSDTTSERGAAEKRQFVESYLRPSRSGSRFELVLFEPTLLDYLLVHADSGALDQGPTTGYGVLVSQSQSRRKSATKHLLAQLKGSPDTRRALRQLPEITRIIAFAAG